ncbi:hypothetical protein DFH28DRAFT_886809 [Melampsora americana]|nr:hypothetical protein DFH28DRAFT_886809 [Melampsora americana]
MASPFLIPLNPLQPLPPIKAGTLTGVICKSPKCVGQKPHSTVFYEPKKQPNAPLIGIRVHDFIGSIPCPSRDWCRTYFRSIYSSSLTNHNQQFTQSKKRKRQQELQDAQLAMDLHNMLNDDDADVAGFLPLTSQSHVLLQPPMPTPTSQPSTDRQTKAGTRLISGGQCQGHKGITGKGHSGRRNNQCSIKACFECCRQLNHLQDCPPHCAQAKAKGKATKAPATSTSATPVDPFQTPEIPRFQQARELPSTQGGGKSYEREVDQDNTFRKLGLHQQAQERLANEAIEKANNTITMVVWAAAASDPIECEIWREYIPHWPRFALDQSEDLKELVERELGTISNQRLKVWSEAEQHWIGLRLSVFETYPDECRRILIKFPNVDGHKCKDMDEQIALVNTFHQKVDLNIDHLCIPDPGCPTIEQLEMMPASSPISQEQTTPASSPLPTISPLASPEIQLFLSGAPIPPAQSLSPEIQIVNSHSVHRTSTQSNVDSKWPVNVSMRLMIQFLQLSTNPNKINIPAAWNKVFGDQGWTFVFPTASLYRRWLIQCQAQGGLFEFVAKNPNSVVQDGLNHFEAEWKECSSKKKSLCEHKSSQSPSKVVGHLQSSKRSRK